MDRDVAWNQIKSITGFGPGGSKSNSLFWAASRNPAPVNYNGSAHAVDIKGSLRSSCSANSACDAVGKIQILNFDSSLYDRILLIFIFYFFFPSAICQFDCIGIMGQCCPTEGTSTTPGIQLGCCPLLK